MASLADRYQKRIDRSKSKSFRTKIKRDSGGKRVGGGTLVTQGTVDAIYADENLQITIGENNVRVIQEAIRRTVTTALEEIGLVAEGAAKRLCPVDTGRLRNSITHAFVAEDEIAIGTNVEYALYVHEGTSKRGGTPFLTRAVQNNAGRFSTIMRNHAQNG